MKKPLLLAAFAACVGASLTSCSQDEGFEGAGVTNAKQNFVKFTVNTNAVAGSRATAITGTNYLDKVLTPSMRVWGYFAHDAQTLADAGIAPGAQYVGSGDGSILIDNNSEGTNANWEYNNAEDQAYWPSEPLNFYAVIGANDTKVVKEVKSVSSDNNLAHVVATVEIPTANADQKDVMFAKSTNQTRVFNAAGIDPVNFSFQHALSQIVFQGRCAAKKISADVESITICNADSKGRVGYLTDAANDVVLGSELAAERGYGKYSVGLISSATLNGNDNLDEAKNLTAADGALMMLPQTGATKWATVPGTPVTIAAADAAHQTYLKISCKIKNDNVYLIGDANTYGEVYIPLTIDWVQGKKYTYTIIFGADAGGYDEDGNPLNSLLPITYTVSAPTEWDVVAPIELP